MEGLAEVLGGLNRNSNIERSAIISRDGLLLKMKPEDTVIAGFASTMATVLGAAEAALSEIGRGIPKRIIVETGKCRIIVMGSGPKALVITVIKSDACMELILKEMEKVAEEIKLSLQKNEKL